MQLRVAEAVGVPPQMRPQLLRDGVVLRLNSSLADAGVQENYRLKLAILPARVALTAAWDGTAKIWNAESGECARTFMSHGDNSDTDSDDDDKKCVNTAVFSANGVTVLTASSDGSVKIWNAQTGVCMQTLGNHGRSQSCDSIGGVNSAVFSPDGTMVLTAGLDGTVKIWNTSTTECTLTLATRGCSCNTAAFSADGSAVLTVFADHIAQIWSTKTGECMQTISGHHGSLVSAVFSPDGASVLTASTDGTARVWSSEAKQFTDVVFSHGKPLSFAVFSADASMVLTASNDGIAQIWSVKTGTCTQTLCPEPDRMGFRPEMVSAVFSPDGAMVLTASADEDLPAAHIWETETGKCIKTLLGHHRAVRSVAFAP